MRNLCVVYHEYTVLSMFAFPVVLMHTIPKSTTHTLMLLQLENDSLTNGIFFVRNADGVAV